MNKLIYDSLYKFIISLGILIMILPILFIMHALNNNELITIKESEIIELTDTAQQIIAQRQNYQYNILNNPGGCCLVISVIWSAGIIIIVYGIKKWNDNVQKNEDKSIVLTNQLLEKRLQSLTPLEKNEKVKEEIGKSENINDKEDIPEEIYEDKISKYIEVQNFVYNKIKNIFDDYKVFEEVKIGKEEYDCIAAGIEGMQFDYIFEIKYWSNTKPINQYLKSMYFEVEKRQEWYKMNTRRCSRNVIIIITDEIKSEDKKLFEDISENSTFMTKVIATDRNELEVELKKIKEEVQ